jgi:hypothetical protein
MKRMMTLAALALLAPVTAMGAAEGGWVPIEPSHDAIADQRQVLLALRCDGVRDVKNLQQVGDYWEASAKVQGKRREVYVFDSGALWVGHRPVIPSKPAALPGACEKGSREIG